MKNKKCNGGHAIYHFDEEIKGLVQLYHANVTEIYKDRKFKLKYNIIYCDYRYFANIEAYDIM